MAEAAKKTTASKTTAAKADTADTADTQASLSERSGVYAQDVRQFVEDTRDALAGLVDEAAAIQRETVPAADEEGAALRLRRVVAATEDVTRALDGVLSTAAELGQHVGV